MTDALEVLMEVHEEEQVEMEVGETIQGSGGTSDYERLFNLPQINSNVVIGNKNGNELGLINSEDTLGMETIDNFFATVFGH